MIYFCGFHEPSSAFKVGGWVWGYSSRLPIYRTRMFYHRKDLPPVLAIGIQNVRWSSPGHLVASIAETLTLIVRSTYKPPGFSQRTPDVAPSEWSGDFLWKIMRIGCGEKSSDLLYLNERRSPQRDMASLLKFGYPVTKPFKYRFFYHLFYFCLFVWILIVTYISVAALGYEYDFTYTTDFNGTYRLWYQTIIPDNPWIPYSKVCQPAIIQVQSSIDPVCFLNWSQLWLQMHHPGPSAI